jgi:primosomal protein N' (replication factor Y)
MPRQTKSGTIPSAIGSRAGVVLPLPLDGAFDYARPAEMDLQRGDFVRVRFGKQELVGVVWGEGEGEIAPDKLRTIEEKLDLAPLPTVCREFVDWVAAYYLAPRGSVLRMAMSVRDAFKPERPIIALTTGGSELADLSPARSRVIAALEARPPALPGELARLAGVSPGVIRQMVKIGQLREIAVARAPGAPAPDPDHAQPNLSEAQALACRSLARTLAGADAGGVTVLDGVTGSGKTEVYFEAVAQCLRQGEQALVLLPEIALTHQWLDRFEARFGVRPGQWHSDLTGLERRRTWRAIIAGQRCVVVGARSALFLPFPRLGLIVVDEEHETAFKQEDGVCYQARDMAVVRGHLAGIPVVLSSATPSLETVQNVAAGKYARLHLPERHGGAPMPQVELIDLRKNRPGVGRWLAPRLVEELKETLARGEQGLLFLNRRGYAPLTLCRHCGHRWQCPHCTAWLVEHRYLGRLQCHHCGYQTNMPSSCPACGAQGELAACGPGVERLNEEIAALFPEARRLILTSDTANSPAKAADMFRRIEEREVDIVVGTQIVAKGHHFPALTLVGVVDADLGLAGGDLRAAERTFQLLHQVSGRAGRADLPGKVLIQTYDSTRPVMLALATGERDRFMALEAADREAAGMPPFGRLAAIVVSGTDPAALNRLCREMARRAPRRDGATVLGPAPAPLAMLKGRHRFRFLLKARRDVAVQPLLRQWLKGLKTLGDQALEVDIDPYSFL